MGATSNSSTSGTSASRASSTGSTSASAITAGGSSSRSTCGQPSSSKTFMVFVSQPFFPSRSVSTVSTFVCCFFDLYSIASICGFKEGALRFIFFTIKTTYFAPIYVRSSTGGSSRGRGGSSGRFRKVVFTFIVTSVFRKAIRMTICNPCSYCRSNIPIVILRVKRRVTILGPFTSNVQRCPFGTVSNDRLRAPLINKGRSSRSVIAFFLSCTHFLSRPINGVGAVASLCTYCHCRWYLCAYFLLWDMRSTIRDNSDNK